MEREAYVKALKVPEEVLKSVLGPEPVDRGLERRYNATMPRRNLPQRDGKLSLNCN